MIWIGHTHTYSLTQSQSTAQHNIKHPLSCFRQYIFEKYKREYDIPSHRQSTATTTTILTYIYLIVATIYCPHCSLTQLTHIVVIYIHTSSIIININIFVPPGPSWKTKRESCPQQNDAINHPSTPLRSLYQ
jgi:hypothetical protein